ncbi:MAG: hypothetical protein Q8P18_31280 [Pseudomonadota bacterium]|nr:hypothetical protein [Pseudomonadota bacterium]
MAFFHAASEHELAGLRIYEDSLDPIDERLADRSDMVLNWANVGVEPCEGGKRVLLIERSTHALAFIVGDGEQFGVVVAPESDEVADIIRRFGIRWSE